MFYCNHCNKRINVSRMSGEDFVHECDSGNDVLDQEDVVIISTEVEEFGETVSTGKLKGDITKQGIGASNFGNRSWIEGETTDDETVRGNNAETTRSRQYYHYIPDVNSISRR